MNDDQQHTQTEEPVTPPRGFAAPRLKIGQRVRVVFTTMAPKFLRSAEGKTGTVCNVVFCRSDGRTVLYGVQYDTPDEQNGTGGRFESFELDPAD